MVSRHQLTQGALKGGRSLLQRHTVLLAYLLALLMFAVTSIYTPGFAAAANVRLLLVEASFIGFAALGQTFVLLGAGVDLSIPSVISAAAVLLTAWAPGSDAQLIWALPAIIALSALVGVINGVGVAFFRISPIVMTLGMNVVVSGALLVYTNGTAASQGPPLIVNFTRADLGPIPVEPLCWAVVAIAACFVLVRTGFGRKLYAVGTSEVVSEFAGINVAAVRLVTYVISGVAAGVAGIMLTGYFGLSYLSIGSPYLFTSVAAPAIGGVSVLGGTGSYAGAVAGALIVTVLTALLPVLGLAEGWQDIVYGLVILATLALMTMRLRERTA